MMTTIRTGADLPTRIPAIVVPVHASSSLEAVEVWLGRKTHQRPFMRVCAECGHSEDTVYVRKVLFC